jgi:hypothetical protein
MNQPCSALKVPFSISGASGHLSIILANWGGSGLASFCSAVVAFMLRFQTDAEALIRNIRMEEVAIGPDLKTTR